MFKKSVLINLVIILFLVLSLNSISPVEAGQTYDGGTHNCRFWGIISTDVPTTVIQDHLVNLPNSIKNLGDSSNPDGWSVGYYPDGNIDPTVNRGFPQAATDPNFNLAATEAANAIPRIAVSHVRNTSSGTTPLSGDPHPFERVKDGRHWLMAQNGTIDKNILYDPDHPNDGLIRSDYFAANPPQYGINQSEWIDTDLYQIFVLQTLEDFNFQVKPALGYVIQRLREEIGPSTSPSTEQINFFLTDGTTLWAYREGNSVHTLYYLYDTTGTPYSAVASQYPSASQGDWIEMANGELVTLEQSRPPVVENIENYFGEALLLDNYFDDNADSVVLRTNGSGQDWYESRADDPSLLFLDETLIGGNGSKKAGFTASTSANVYLSQEFTTPQSGTFSIQWDIYLNNILDSENRDRGGLMLIGDDSDGINGPNSTSDDRFVFMALYCEDGCETGTADLIAREPGNDYATSTEWRTVATGLNLDQWTTIQVDCDLSADTYDVYVGGVLADSGVQAFAPKASVSHISFAQWNDGTGAFYIDNVYQVSTGSGYRLTMAVDPFNSGITNPNVGTHPYAEDTLVTISAFNNPGYEFDHWTGDVTDPNSASTTVLMDEDQTVMAHYAIVPIALLADNYFDNSADSASLRANSPGQDWYESYGEAPTKLTLDSSNTGGNSGNKAALKFSDPTGIGFAYLTQEFSSPQSGTFRVSFDIYIDSIQDNGDRDRTGMIFIGEDNGGTNGANSTDAERFMYLTFYDPSPTSDENDMEIRVREYPHSHPTNPQLWGTTSTWTQIADGLSYDTWYKISLTGNVAEGTYDVYVDDALLGDDISGYEDYSSNPVSHISFSTGTAAQGDFYVDNVEETNDSSIEIDANFDSGSIGAYSLSGNEININLRTDNVGYEYWTYFSASNVLNQEITVNISGVDSIPFFAEQTEENQMVYSCDNENWNRLISHSYSTDSGGTYTFVETFTCDPVQIATFFPFTYEKMHYYVDTVSASPWAEETVLGSSHQGRDIDLLTITNSAIPNAGKQTIYIIGRQHSAETSSSHMLEGMIDFLISGSPDAVQMRDNFVWYIVPMVNPDGVYSGKSRETSEGNDPNRDWHRSNSDTQGVSLVKTHIDLINSSEGIEMFIDWHSQMNDDRWYNFTYAPSGNTFFPFLSSWTDLDSQSTGGTSCSVDSCSARGFATIDLGLLMFGFEPTPHLATWTEVSLNGQGELVAYAIDEYFIPTSGPLLVDPEFDDSSDSADLRTNSTGQDWFESRGDTYPDKLTLDTSDIGGNTGNKAALKYSDPAGTGYAYLTQEFGSPQSSTFSVSLDIYIDSIADDADRDRSGMIYIGDDSGGTSGPNSGSGERFVFLAFYDPNLGSGDNDLEIRAREYRHDNGTTPQSWNTTSAWTQVASGLSYDTWYEIRLDVDVTGGTYDVYVDGVLAGTNISSYEDYPSSSVTHISFSTGTATQGNFYVDKVQEAGEMQCFSSTGTYTFNSQSGVEIEVASLGSELGCLYVDEVPANHPSATGTEGNSGIMTSRYWTIHGLQSDGSTSASGYTLNMTLPHNVTPHSNAYVCKHSGSQGGSGWNCSRTGSDTSTVWLYGITSLSDWAIGDNVGPTAISLKSLTASSSSPADNLFSLAAFAALGLVVFLSLGFVRNRRHRMED